MDTLGNLAINHTDESGGIFEPELLMERKVERSFQVPLPHCEYTNLLLNTDYLTQVKVLLAY